MDQEAKSAIDVLALSLESFIKQLEGDENASSTADASQYDEAEFSEQLGVLADMISHECTKFSMVFTDAATPSEKASESLSNRLIGMAAALFKITISLPSSGIRANFRQSVVDAVIDVFRSIASLAIAAKEGAANTKAQLKETGTVWESCDRLKAVPKNSRELLLRVVAETLSMVNDAFSEIQELNDEAKAGASKEDGDDSFEDEHASRSLSETEKLQLSACSQLVKAAKAVVSKIQTIVEQSTAESKSTVAADDELTTLVSRVSPLVDNVVSLFHEDALDSETEVTELHDAIKATLTTFKKTPYYQEAHSKWLEVVCTAVQHNLTKYRNTNESASK